MFITRRLTGPGIGGSLILKVMKKRFSRFSAVFAVILAGLLSSCGPRLVLVSDPLWEEFAVLTERKEFSTAYQLSRGGCKVFDWPGPADQTELASFLAEEGSKYPAVFWDPRWFADAAAFSRDNPEVYSLVPVTVYPDPGRELPRNLGVVIMDRTPAYGELGKYAASLLAQGKEVHAFFTVSGDLRDEELAAYRDAAETPGGGRHRLHLINSQDDRKDVLSVLRNETGEPPALVILSAGEHNLSVYQALQSLETEFFIEYPNPLLGEPGILRYIEFEIKPVLKEILLALPENRDREYRVPGHLRVSGKRG